MSTSQSLSTTDNSNNLPNRSYRWGIIGAGSISTDFIHALVENVPEAIIVCIGAREITRAQSLADKFHIPRAYGSYEEVVNDSTIDIVYIGTVHSHHAQHASMAIAKGKAVLVEKSFTQNAKQAKSIIDQARGGSLLDIGIYPLSIASLIYGSSSQPPSQISAMGELLDSGVDASIIFSLKFGPHQFAQCFSSVIVNGPRTLHVIGSKGRILVHDESNERHWYGATKMKVFRQPQETQDTIHQNNKDASLPLLGGVNEQDYTFPLLSSSGEWNGSHRVLLAYEAREVHRCLNEGLKESPLMRLDETLMLMKVMDEIRRQVGVIYPNETINQPNK